MKYPSRFLLLKHQASTGLLLMSLLVLAGWLGAQTPWGQKNFDLKTATNIVSRLSLGMKEEEVNKILNEHGMTNDIAFSTGHGWSYSFSSTNGLQLNFRYRPKQARADGAWVWADGLLESAVLIRNGSKMFTLPGTNAVVSGSKTNR